jgi:hypothetical protein
MDSSDNIGLTEFLVLVYQFLKRNLLIIAITTVFGVALGFLYTSQKSKYYETELVGFSNVIDKTTLLEIANPLTALVEQKNFTELAIKLGITPEEASQIRALEFTESRHLVTSHAPKTTDQKLGELIIIKAAIYDQQIIKTLSSGIVYYLENNPLVSKTNQLMIRKNQTLITEMTRNIALIDSLNRSLLTQNGTAVSFQQSQNPISHGEALLMLEDLKITASTLAPFTIASPFYKASKPANKNLLIMAVITMTFFMLSLLIVFIKELAKLAAK